MSIVKYETIWKSIHSSVTKIQPIRSILPSYTKHNHLCEQNIICTPNNALSWSVIWHVHSVICGNLIKSKSTALPVHRNLKNLIIKLKKNNSRNKSSSLIISSLYHKGPVWNDLLEPTYRHKYLRNCSGALTEIAYRIYISCFQLTPVSSPG